MKNWKVLLFLISAVSISFGILCLLGLAARNGFLDDASSSSALDDYANDQVIDLREAK